MRSFYHSHIYFSIQQIKLDYITSQLSIKNSASQLTGAVAVRYIQSAAQQDFPADMFLSMRHNITPIPRVLFGIL
jgi:hypothetical protein